MKIIGLNIDKGSLSVSVVLKSFRQTELQESYTVTFATDAELTSILKEKSRDWAGARIVSSIPGSYFSQRLLTFPFSDRKRLEKAIPFELEDSVPFPLDEVVVDHIALDGAAAPKEGGTRENAALAVMLPKGVCRQHLDLLAGAGTDPHVIVPSYLGLLAVAKLIKSEGTVLVAAGRDVCLKHGEAVKSLRTISAGPTGGLGHTIKALETEFSEKITKIVLLDDNPDMKAAALHAGFDVEQIAPEFYGKRPANPASLGLALVEDVNLRKGEFAYRPADEGARRKRKALYIAGAAAVALGVVNFGVKVYLAESSYGRVVGEMQTVYRRTFPDARKTDDPYTVMKAMFSDAQKKYGALGSGASALDVMKAVTEVIPREVRVTFQDFNLEGERLRLQGEATSFEAVDKIKSELQKAGPFSEVNVQDTRMGVESRVKFRMELKLKQPL